MRSNIRRHPLATYAPGQVVGYVNGRPIYPIAGGNGEGEPPSGQGNPPAGPPAAPPAANFLPPTDPPAPPAPPVAPPAKEPAKEPTKGDVKSLPDWAQKIISDANAEAAKSRTTAKANAAAEAKAEVAQIIGKALGLVEDETPPDPAKLAEQISSQTSEINGLKDQNRTLTVELAVWAAAEKAGAKAGALLDSRGFLKAIGELDPTAKTFATALGDAIKAAVDANPNFRAAPQAGRSGADLTGGTGESGTKQRPSLSGAIGAHYGTT